MRCRLAMLLLGLLGTQQVASQELHSHALAKPAAASPEEMDLSDKQWSFSALGSFYFVPQDVDYFSPVLMADYKSLHLEARYNYEGIDAASLWLGYNFSIGEKVKFDFTPMVGGIFGNTCGVAPGWRMALSAGKFELSSESEYVFDSRNSSDNFFYTWSELRWHVMEWMSLGVAAQRSRTFETHLDVQRGLLAGFTFKDVDFTFYVFNLGWEDPTFVVSVGINF